jgi:FkbM family methyltransferase
MSVVDLDRHGVRWRVYNPGGRLGMAYENGRPYEHQLLDEWAQRGFSGCGIDVGAHVGNHTLFMAAVLGLHVVAIEPWQTAHDALLDNLALNPGLDVETFCLAAGRSQGWGRLSSLMRVDPDPEGDVMVCSIDELICRDDVSLVKVDVEGYESEVLAGMVEHLARCRPSIYAECHSRTAWARIADVLGPCGYVAAGTIEMGSPMTRWEPR